MKYIFLTALFTLITLFTHAQTFHEEIDLIFSFYPHKISRTEMQKVVPKLDSLFHKVIADKDTYLPLLREELKKESHNPYFYFDGGVLLSQISAEPEDMQLIADALVKCDLRDVPPKVYLQHILRLSQKNANVIDAGLHILDDTTFQILVEQHVLLINQGEALKFILPRYDSPLYVKKLIGRYKNTDSDKKKITIIELLYYSRNCEADQFMNERLKASDESEKVKSLIRKIKSSKPSKAKEKPDKYNEIREQIRTNLVRLSDEALEELNSLTIKLSLYYSCN